MDYIKKYFSNRLRLIYVAPFLLCIFVVFVYGFHIKFLPAYIAAALPVLCFYAEKKKWRISVIALAVLFLIGNIGWIYAMPPEHKDYYKDFETGFSVMKEHYVLDKEKGIDWGKLYSKYEPLFKEADRLQDPVYDYELWQEYTGEFYDGHVEYMLKDEDDGLRSVIESYGNDYGLSLVRLSTGEYAAVNVEGYDNSYSINDEEDDYGFYRIDDDYHPADVSDKRLTLKNAGLQNGSIITKWNGEDITEYYDDVKYYLMQYPVKENEEFYLPMYVAGIGNADRAPYAQRFDKDNGSVTISFLDENGTEQTVEAPSLGAYTPRLMDTFSKIDSGVNITNLTWQRVNDDTMLLRIREMAYDADTYAGVDYSVMTNKLREEILAYKDAGIKNIIFDMRGNSGGSPWFVMSLAGLFAPEGEHVASYSAVIDKESATFIRDAEGKYIKNEPLTYTGEDLWHDGQIILLVNAMCVSAGDDMTYTMGEYPNVKVMGFTRTNSSCQAVTYESLETGDISFSAVPNLDEESEPLIDTRSDRLGRTPFDEYIPMDTEAVKAIFDLGEDYALNYTQMHMDCL